MKNSLKITAASIAISLLSGCAMTTAPQSSTYWLKDDGSTYQTHRDRIVTHDKRIECAGEVRDHKHSKDYTEEQYSKHFKACMNNKHYKEVSNWYDIKPSQKIQK